MSTIMPCIKSVSYPVLLNGEPMGHIKPARGLHQGDPLSLYKFLLCAIGLQELFHKAKSDCSIRGVSICWNGPRVPHIFFADDSKEAECQVILDILATYEKGSGQKINKNKTNIFFSSNTYQDV